MNRFMETGCEGRESLHRYYYGVQSRLKHVRDTIFVLCLRTDSESRLYFCEGEEFEGWWRLAWFQGCTGASANQNN